MDFLKQAHYYSLPSQGNVYTLANLHLANNSNKLLFASLKRQVFCFEYLESATGILMPTTKEISFTYIPNGAEIISLDAFNKSEDKNDFIIGITIIKNSLDNVSIETYLNVYSVWDESEEFNIDSIAQNCLNVELSFTPYQLTHTYLVTWTDDKLESKVIVFLLTGSDKQIHVFKERTSNHTYKEIDVWDLFPEFSKPPSIVLWVDVYYYNNYAERITVFGCECGYLRLTKVCCKTNKILYNLSTKFVSSIAQVKLYPQIKPSPKPPFLADYIKNPTQNIDLNLNLIVVNSILPAVYFQDIVNFGLNKSSTLRRTEMTSVSTCVEIADVDFDGEKEILIGNSAEEINVYKVSNNEAKMINITNLVGPIFKLCYLDLTGDGVKELVVFTMKGLYILQHDPRHVQKVLESKVTSLTIPNIDDVDVVG